MQRKHAAIIACALASAGIVYTGLHRGVSPINSAPRTVTNVPANISWHPANWDTTLPGGMSPIRVDGYRIVPDTTLTPGVADPNVTLAQLANPAYIKAKRNVPDSEKKAAYAEYHYVKDTANHPCEVDHDISLENGGLNGLVNVWVEPYFGPWNAHDKDLEENKLHSLCKSGAITLAEDQDDLRGFHWCWTYIHIFGHTPAAASD